MHNLTSKHMPLEVPFRILLPNFILTCALLRNVSTYIKLNGVGGTVVIVDLDFLSWTVLDVYVLLKLKVSAKYRTFTFIYS